MLEIKSALSVDLCRYFFSYEKFPTSVRRICTVNIVCCILSCQIVTHLLQSVVHIVSVKNAFFKQFEQCIFIVSIRLHRYKFYFGFIIIIIIMSVGGE